jgi:hypothetical protein
MNEKVQNEINRQLKVQVASVKILFSLRMTDLVVNYIVNQENSESVNSMFKVRNIYNYKTAKRREALEFLILIQRLIRELNNCSN